MIEFLRVNIDAWYIFYAVDLKLKIIDTEDVNGL
jgi:hypothetical protein